ncbi:MAG: hypothetical protein KIH89_002200 [Candidatus Shapirobacteria bacterium]|nr:hypothetical protein [Candidatus Shapirobacteria bacterium]
MTNETLRDICSSAFKEHGFVDPDPTSTSFEDSLTASTGYIYPPKFTERLKPCFEFDTETQEIHHTSEPNQKPNP